jgi:hypothetical protein
LGKKDTIDGFKSKLEHYKMFKEGKWEDWVEDVFMSSNGSWAFLKSMTTFHLNLSILGCSK